MPDRVGVGEEEFSVGGGSALTICSLLSFGLALGALTRSQWGPLLESSISTATTLEVVARAAPIYAVVSGLHAYVVWTFNRFLIRAYSYRGADRAVLLAVVVLGLDVLANLYLLLSGAPGFQVYSIPLGFYGAFFSYPQFAYVTLGVALIAFGYSLLRFPHDLGGILRLYARVQIVTGAALVAPPLAGLWPWPAALGHVVLGILLLRESVPAVGGFRAMARRGFVHKDLTP
jgi:hypothetical protein